VNGADGLAPEALDATLACDSIARPILCMAALRAWSDAAHLTLTGTAKDSLRLWCARSKPGWLGPRLLMTGASGSAEAAATALRAMCGQEGAIDLIYGLVPTGAARQESQALDDLDAPVGWQLIKRSTSYRYVLPLEDDHPAFLRKLGKHTRRNIRLAERHADVEGYRFEFALEPPPPAKFPERARVGALTMPVAKTPPRLAALDGFLCARRHPFHSAVRAGNGRLLSLAAGFITGDAAFLVYQLNDRLLPEASLALLNRAHVIRMLIDKRVREFVFPNGIRDGGLKNACVRHHGLELLLRRDSRWVDAKLRLWARRGRPHPVLRMLSRQDPKG
jgi:hypothetical protein